MGGSWSRALVCLSVSLSVSLSVCLSVCLVAVTYEGPGQPCGIIGLLSGEHSRVGGLFKGRHANLSRASYLGCCSSLYTHTRTHTHGHTPPGGLRAVCVCVYFTPTLLRSTSPLCSLAGRPVKCATFTGGQDQFQAPTRIAASLHPAS